MNSMKARYITQSKKHEKGCNIFADKSSIVLEWLLCEGLQKPYFSIREVQRDTKISIGLIQKIFSALIYDGFLQVIGVRTAKKFSIQKPKLLMDKWLSEYTILNKCKVWTYRCALSKQKMQIKLKDLFKSHKICSALHTSADQHGLKNTNLETFEYYLLDPLIRTELEKELCLEPCERGYDLLLIEPYYKKMLFRSNSKTAPIFLTFLDLYNFPLRGREQAEYIAKHDTQLKRIYRWKKR